jgi:hypothetical protein
MSLPFSSFGVRLLGSIVSLFMRYVGQLDNICPLIDWKLAIDGMSQFIGYP